MLKHYRLPWTPKRSKLYSNSQSKTYQMKKKEIKKYTNLEVLKHYLPYDIVNHIKDEMYRQNREDELNWTYFDISNSNLILTRLFEWERTFSGFGYWSNINLTYFQNHTFKIEYK